MQAPRATSDTKPNLVGELAVSFGTVALNYYSGLERYQVAYVSAVGVIRLLPLRSAKDGARKYLKLKLYKFPPSALKIFALRQAAQWRTGKGSEHMQLEARIAPTLLSFR